MHSSQWITFPIQSCLVLFSFSVNFLHLLIMWRTVLSLSSHNLHLLFHCVLSIFAVIYFILMTLFCVTIKRDSVSLFRFPHFSHVQVISYAISPNLKQNFIAYRSFKVSDCIFEIHQLWQSDFSRVYSNYCCSCWFEPEIIKIGQSSHKMYSNKILNFQESTTILNACTKKSGNLLNAPRNPDHDIVEIS